MFWVFTEGYYQNRSVDINERCKLLLIFDLPSPQSRRSSGDREPHTLGCLLVVILDTRTLSIGNSRIILECASVIMGYTNDLMDCVSVRTCFLIPPLQMFCISYI